MPDLTEILSHAAAIVGKIGAGKTYVAKGGFISLAMRCQTDSTQKALPLPHVAG